MKPITSLVVILLLIAWLSFIFTDEMMLIFSTLLVGYFIGFSVKHSNKTNEDNS